MNNCFLLEPDARRIFEQLKSESIPGIKRGIKPSELNVLPPKPIVKRPSLEIYNGYRSAYTTACADVVIFTKTDEWSVLLSQRSNDKCFGGKWWVYGGGLPAYADINEFLKRKVVDESGCIPEIRALVGIAFTSAEDSIGSTSQPCYLATVSADETLTAKVDIDHSATRLFTPKEYFGLSSKERYWYIDQVVDSCFEALEMFDHN